MKLISNRMLLIFIMSYLFSSGLVIANSILAHSELEKCGNFNVIGFIDFDNKNSRKLFVIYPKSLKETEFILEGRISPKAISSRENLVKINIDFKNNKIPKFLFKEYIEVASKTESYENTIELVKEAPCEN